MQCGHCHLVVVREFCADVTLAFTTFSVRHVQMNSCCWLNVSIVVVNFCSVSLTCLDVNALSLVLCIVVVVAATADDATATTAAAVATITPLLLSITFVIVAVKLTIDDVGFHCCVC